MEGLQRWLNEEVGLSKHISNFEKDFANGYFFGEIFNRYNMQVCCFRFLSFSPSSLLIVCVLHATNNSLNSPPPLHLKIKWWKYNLINSHPAIYLLNFLNPMKFPSMCHMTLFPKFDIPHLITPRALPISHPPLLTYLFLFHSPHSPSLYTRIRVGRVWGLLLFFLPFRLTFFFF